MRLLAFWQRPTHARARLSVVVSVALRSRGAGVGSWLRTCLAVNDPAVYFCRQRLGRNAAAHGFARARRGQHLERRLLVCAALFVQELRVPRQAYAVRSFRRGVKVSGEGENMLGKLLVQRRDELAEKKAAAAAKPKPEPSPEEEEVIELSSDSEAPPAEEDKPSAKRRKVASEAAAV